MERNLQKIKTQLDNPDTLSKDEVIVAANAIAAAANTGLGALYAPSRDKGEGWRKTRLKSAFFEKPEEAKKVALQFNLEANEFAKVAATGDVGQIKAKFGKLTQSCKSCHDSFREKDAK
ncbi:cytochrome c [Methylophilus medardicus]|uniref:cytochrome c n=1 Tax=Methylophilus medardicus TaxID=2588534 RepID=UPI001CB8940E|nr:cytochrome c [Methylophilus medardicus]